MSKILINSSIKSSSEEETLVDEKAILKDEIITFNKNGITTSISIKDLIIKRENDEMKITLEFNKDKKTSSFYDIKTLNLRINVNVITKSLHIKDNSLYINYDLYMNNEFSDNFNYKLEWRDYNAS